tara:strand:- start:53530 stop:54195 length:666 start_codon:yes stop_codon:yes gene_type:complete
MKTIAVCQPYFAPHLAYFQLINAVDVFVSYDDVNYITRGWINRNKLTINKKEKIFTIPVKKQSSFSKINQIEVDWENREINKLLKTVNMSYSKSKYREQIFNLLEEIFYEKPRFISDLSLKSLKVFSDYLEIQTCFKVSSHENYVKTGDRVKNLINICHAEKASSYINSIGGTSLYRKEEFAEHGLNLGFLSGLSGLSIIDVCMNNSIEEIKKQLQQYTLV